MPVTLVDRLPLPNLKVYSAGSVLLLSVAVYYAVNVTSDPNWRSNATLQRQEADSAESDVMKMIDAASAAMEPNTTRNVSEHVIEVMTFMMQEPLCMWTLINMAYCTLALVGFVVQRAVFGRLRVSEAQRVKDKFWNYVFYKFIFVFGVLNVQYMDEVLMWCGWFTLVGALLLLTQLSKDRFEYLSSSPSVSRWAHGRLLALLGGILCAGGALLAAALRWGLPAGRDTFAFMAAECVLACVSCVHVMARFVLRARDADAAAPAAYYTHLVFDSVSLVVETAHVAHMVVHSNAVVSMASLVLLMQLRHLLHALLARLRRHRLYTALADHMSRNYPMASPEEVQKHQDNCAICWEPMKEARKLPCAHLFHNSCLCRWVQQDASCPTCRRALSAQPAPLSPLAPLNPLSPLTPLNPLNPLNPLTQIGDANNANHLFHFDGSRYVSWLPSFSVEVTRVRAELPAAPAPAPATPVTPTEPARPAPAPAPAPPSAPEVHTPHLDAMLAQVLAVFPQAGAARLRADLLRTRSPHLTIDNILEGRLAPAPPAPPTPPPTAPTPAPDTHTVGDSASDSDSEVDTGTSTSSLDSRATPAPHPSDVQEPVHVEFSKNASDREILLRKRKQQLVAAARHKYLERMSRDAPAAHPAPSAPPARPERERTSANTSERAVLQAREWRLNSHS